MKGEQHIQNPEKITSYQCRSINPVACRALATCLLCTCAMCVLVKNHMAHVLTMEWKIHNDRQH